MYRFYLPALFLIISVSSCALFEAYDKVPMFIEINSVSLETESGQGSNHHKIIDIWPTADGEGLGVFEMPITFPVLDEDENTKMFYQAGIRRLGEFEDHTIYPFYERLEVDHNFEENTTITPDLKFKYKESTVFRMVQGFDNQVLFTNEVDDDSLTVMTIVEDDCAEGFCGLIKLTPENPEFAAASSELYVDIPTNGTAVYLEMEYKTDINLSIGLQSEVNGTDFEQYFITVLPTDTWNKVYIDMAEILLASQLDSYRIVLGALNTTDGPVEVRVDNIKLLHF